MSEFLGLDLPDVITTVKYALTAAQLQSGKEGLPFKLGQVDLNLKLVHTQEVGAKPKFKVPVLDWELGGEVKISSEQTQTLSISLAPPTVDALTSDDREMVDTVIDIPITLALIEIARAVTSAKEGDPQLGLSDDGASIELNFAATADGKLTLLIYEGSLKHATTSTLKVKVVAA